MRTTVTLDPDVEALLRKEMQERRKSFKRALNDAIRDGLKTRTGPAEPSFGVVARPLGLRPGIDPVALRDLDDELEIEEFLRKTRKLERGKA
jgi:hypothetical protein